ncbi:MAG: hypothetical protein ABIW82_17280 [Dokdonella sp.]
MLKAAQAQVQKLYERGSLSYPRTSANAITPATLASIATLLPRVGRSSTLANTVAVPMFDDRHPEPHEALHPTTEALRTINFSIPEWMLESDDRLLQRLARHLVRCAAPIDIERPSSADGLPEWASGLDWTRPAPGTSKQVLESDEASPSVGVTLYGSEEIALRALIRAGLGRASSIVSHAVHAAERGIVDASGLTAKGKSLLAASPKEIADPRVAQAIEATLDKAFREATRQPRSSTSIEAVEAGPMDLVELAVRHIEPLRPQIEAALRLEERRITRKAHDNGRAGVANVEETACDRDRDLEAAELRRARSLALSMETGGVDASPEDMRPLEASSANSVLARLLQEELNSRRVEEVPAGHVDEDEHHVLDREGTWHSPFPTL